MTPDAFFRLDRWRCRLSLLIVSLTTTLGLAAETDEEIASPAKTSRMSSRISTAIRAALPDYDPPPKRDTPKPDPTDTANLILMNPVIVTDHRMSATPWEMLTATGKADYLKKRYKGATVPGDALSQNTPNYAMLMHWEDARIQSLHKIDAMSGLDQFKDDPEAHKRLKKELTEVRMRRMDGLTEAMDKSVNYFRR